jgi:hypothetical protein
MRARTGWLTKLIKRSLDFKLLAARLHRIDGHASWWLNARISATS